MLERRWDPSQPDRRTHPRASYRRTPPARLDIGAQACAVRDVGPGGLRIEPVPPSQVWHPGQAVSGNLYLRTSPALRIAGRIVRLGLAGMAIVPDGTGAWPAAATIDTERNEMQRPQRDRRSEPRIGIPLRVRDGTSPSALRDVSAGGLRYCLPPGEQAPAIGSRTGGDVRLDADTVITIRGRVIRCTGREVAIALDPPGVAREVLERLRARFLGSATPSA